MGGNIYFVGLMGAGKTTIGKLIAKHLDKVFYDSDQEIEKRTGVNIPLIFELEGEAGFRKREAAVIAELTAMHDIVMATGGGVVLREENRKNLQTYGTVIYLRASVHDLWQRTKNDKNRPLLQGGNVKEKLEKLFSERDPLYREVASLVIDTGGQPIHQLVNHIEQKLKQLSSV
jgi:shikimate kinase